MKKTLSALLVSSVLLLPVAAQTPSPQGPSAKVDYEKDVKPLLSQNCYGCHGPEVQQSGLRLDLRQNALRGGDYGPVIVPGKSAESKLIHRLVDGDGGMQMPPTGRADDRGDRRRCARGLIRARISATTLRRKRRRSRSIRSWRR